MAPTYVTVAQLKAFKGADGAVFGIESLFSDTEIEDAIIEVEQQIEDVCGCKFSSTTATKYFNGCNGSLLFFPPLVRDPLLTITSCQQVDEDDTVEFTFVEGDDFVNRGHYLEMVNTQGYHNLRRRLDVVAGLWGLGTNNIKIVGTWGMASTPKDILRAIKLLAIERLLPGKTYLRPQEVSEQEWPDYRVKYVLANQNAAGPLLTGFGEVDRILKRHINYASMFIRQGEIKSADYDYKG